MNSKAFRDYFRSFRRKEVWKAIGLAIPLYIWLMVGPFPAWDGENADVAAFFYYSGAFSVMLRLIERRVYPLGLSKLQHLCPMSRKQKEDYVRTQFWVGFMVAFALFAFLQIIFWIVFPQEIYYILPVIMLVVGLLGISFSAPVNNLMEPEKLETFREKELKGVNVKGLIVVLIGIISWSIVTVFITDGGEIPLWIWIVTAILLIWQLWMTFSMLGRIKYLVALASDYERTND